MIFSAKVIRQFSIGAILITAVFFLTNCGGGSSGSDGMLRGTESACDGKCPNTNLTVEEVASILSRAANASRALSSSGTFAITDRVGNVLAVYQTQGSLQSVTISGAIGAVGGLEGLIVPAALVAISKAGTAAFLSSQGNAFSTRTASFIVQEHFAPGQKNAPAGPLFGVQFSQLPCSDIKDPTLGPRPLPLGLSADPGGIPIYKAGDVVGGIGVEIDGLYTFDKNIEDTENNIEEIVALAASKDFEAPEEILAERITVGGQALRFSDISYADALSASEPELNEGLNPELLLAVPPFTDGKIQAGKTFGTSASGIVLTERVGAAAAYLVRADGSPRFPSVAGKSSTEGAGLNSSEVEALLDSAIATANRSRAAIRRPLGSAARVSIFVVDDEGKPLGFTRSEDAPVFGIDVALQKARTAAFFSSEDAGTKLSAAGLGSYADRSSALFEGGFNGSHAFSCRAIGNVARPFFPDGIDGSAPGPLSLPFPGLTSGTSWSPFNTGLQLDLIFSAVAAPLSGTIPSSCTSPSFGKRLGNGIQIFSGSVPLYRSGKLIGAMGISGDGIFQDDIVAFLGASRQGLDFVGHTALGDPQLGFNAPHEIRSDRITPNGYDFQLRYINCPESPFLDGSNQEACGVL